MSAWIKLSTAFFTHRKTVKLRSRIGDAGLWIPPRLWTYAADNQEDGVFSNYEPAELAVALGYAGDADKLLAALIDCGFLDTDPLRIHDWLEHNAWHLANKNRARKAALARWSPPQTPPNQENQEKITNQPTKSRSAPSIAPSIAQALPAAGGEVAIQGGFSSESGLVNGVGGSVQSLARDTRMALPQPCRRPSEPEVAAFLRLKFRGADEFAGAFIRAMEKSGWTDNEGRTIGNWQARAEAYANSAARKRRGIRQ